MATSSLNLNPQRGWRRLLGADPWFLGVSGALLAIGLMALFSVSRAGDASIFRKQVFFLLTGLVPFAIFFAVPPFVLKRSAPFFYFLNLGLLLAVELAGETRKGAQRWIDIKIMEFQPSELSKILIVLTLSAFFASRQEDVKKFSTFALSFLHILPTLILIFRQPHLGATLTILVSWMVICIVARVPWKTITFTVLAVAAVGVFAVKTPGVLNEYQMKRLQELVVSDSRTTGYQQFQAEIAIGTGGIEGKGYLRGDRKSMQVVPEQQNDFIFTVVGEEGGLFGSALVLFTFAAFFLRGWYLAYQMEDGFSRSATLGVLAALAFHWIVNMAMNLGLGPVVGLWLPFLSSGGTALWLCMAIVGLILNLAIRAEEGFFSRDSSRTFLSSAS